MRTTRAWVDRLLRHEIRRKNGQGYLVVEPTQSKRGPTTWAVGERELEILEKVWGDDAWVGLVGSGKPAFALSKVRESIAGRPAYPPTTEADTYWLLDADGNCI